MPKDSSKGHDRGRGSVSISQPAQPLRTDSNVSVDDDSSLNDEYSRVELPRHVFEKEKFTKPCRCKHCGQFVWGGGSKKVGLSCKLCETTVHSTCSKLISEFCQRPLNPIVGRVRIKVIAGRKLAARDFTGKSDPYCIINVGSASSKTKTIYKTLNPVWTTATGNVGDFSVDNEHVHIFDVMDTAERIKIEIWDWDRIGSDDSMGQVIMPVTDLLDETVKDVWLSVRPLSTSDGGVEAVSGDLRVEAVYQSFHLGEEKLKKCPDFAELMRLFRPLENPDAEAALLGALLDTRTINSIKPPFIPDSVMRALIDIYDAESAVFHLAIAATKVQLSRSKDASQVFPTGCGHPATRFISHILSRFSKEWAVTALRPSITKIGGSAFDIIVHPSLVKDSKVLKVHQGNLSSLLEAITRRIAEEFPPPRPLQILIQMIVSECAKTYKNAANLIVPLLLIQEQILPVFTSPQHYDLLRSDRSEPLSTTTVQALSTVARLMDFCARGELPTKENCSESLLKHFDASISNSYDIFSRLYATLVHVHPETPAEVSMKCPREVVVRSSSDRSFQEKVVKLSTVSFAFRNFAIENFDFILAHEGIDPKFRSINYLTFSLASAAPSGGEGGPESSTPDMFQNTKLHRAAIWGQAAKVRMELKKNNVVDPRNALGETPLHLACIEGRYKVVGILLDEGADVDAQSLSGDTPLHNAARNGKDEIVELLLLYGCDADVVNGENKRAIDVAASKKCVKKINAVLEEKKSNAEPEISSKSADSGLLAGGIGALFGGLALKGVAPSGTASSGGSGGLFGAFTTANAGLSAAASEAPSSKEKKAAKKSKKAANAMGKADVVPVEAAEVAAAAEKKPIAVPVSVPAAPAAPERNDDDEPVLPGARTQKAVVQARKERSVVTQQRAAVSSSALMKGKKEKVLGPYRLEKTLGVGAFGKVKLTTHIETGQQFAIKIISRTKLTDNEALLRLQREIGIMQLFTHPNLCEIYETFQTNKAIYIVLELLGGKDLFDYIVDNEYIQEKEARRLTQQVVNGLFACHRVNVIHRDIKPENILLSKNHKSVKLIDFGLSTIVPSVSNGLTTCCGSPYYVAPEVLEGKQYDYKADVWAMGMTTYAMLCGYLPLDEDNEAELYRKMERLDTLLEFPRHVSPVAQDLVRYMLQPRPERRYSLKQVAEHPWLRTPVPEPLSMIKCVKTEVLDEMGRRSGTSSGAVVAKANRVIAEGYPPFSLFPDEKSCNPAAITILERMGYPRAVVVRSLIKGDDPLYLMLYTLLVAHMQHTSKILTGKTASQRPSG